MRLRKTALTVAVQKLLLFEDMVRHLLPDSLRKSITTESSAPQK